MADKPCGDECWRPTPRPAGDVASRPADSDALLLLLGETPPHEEAALQGAPPRTPTLRSAPSPPSLLKPPSRSASAPLSARGALLQIQPQRLGRQRSKGHSVVAAAAAILTPPPTPSGPSTSSASGVPVLRHGAASTGALGSTAVVADGGHLAGVPPLTPSRQARCPDEFEAFENWRLDFNVGGPAAVHVSEFADMKKVAPSPEPRREAYGRPTNKRDLGHRCYSCRRPFSNLGAPLVVELQGGPAQRFHSDCWQKRSGGDQLPVMWGRRPSPGVAGPSSELQDEDADIVGAYADSWRRSHLDPGRPVIRRRSLRSPSREPLLTGVATIEDERGERRVVRGFTAQEIEAVMGQWVSSSTMEEECAICFECRSGPLVLPCGHSFCADCVEPWLRRCGLCPMCRAELRPPGPPSSRSSMATSPVPTTPGGLQVVASRGGSRRGSLAPHSAAPQAAAMVAAAPGEWGMRVHRCGLPRPGP